jgi:hypothetical protein
MYALPLPAGGPVVRTAVPAACAACCAVDAHALCDTVSTGLASCLIIVQLSCDDTQRATHMPPACRRPVLNSNSSKTARSTTTAPPQQLSMQTAPQGLRKTRSSSQTRVRTAPCSGCLAHGLEAAAGGMATGDPRRALLQLRAPLLLPAQRQTEQLPEQQPTQQRQV